MSTCGNPKFWLIALALVPMTLGGCIYEVGLPADGDKQFGRLVPIQGMHQQTHYKDQAAQPIFREDQPEGMRYPPPRTVTVDGFLRDEEPRREDSARIINPVPRTAENLEYGQYLYQEQCAVCHGLEGHGDGPIVEAGHFQPAPPSFHTLDQREQADGEIYHVISHGVGTMWAYDTQLTEIERWTVVHYVRALQRSQYPEPRDIERIRGN